MNLALLVALSVVQAPPLTLERLVADPPLAGTPPAATTPSPGGRWLAFTQGSASDSEVMDLWAMPLAGGEARVLLRASELAPGPEKLTEAERMERERKRIGGRGITSFGWCGADDRALLVPYSGDLYHVRLNDGAAPTVTRLTQDEAPEMDPRCDASGAHVAFVKGQDLWVTDVGGQPTQLTHATSKTTSFGVAEFIAAEEMGRFEGYQWSSDGARLVVFEVDEAPVAEKVRPMIFADRTELYTQRYPAAGEANATVRLHVVARVGGASMPVVLPPEDGYVARAGFADDGALLVQWQSRDQKRLQLLEAKAPTWTPRKVLEERDDAWVELTDDLRVLDAKRLLWTSEKSGARQVYVVDRASGKAKMLAKLDEPVRALVGVDAARNVVFVEAGVDQGREQHVFELPLDGKKPKRITTDPGTHRVVFDATGKTFVDSWSRFGQPTRVTLRRADGSVVQVLSANPADELMALARSTPIVVAVNADDGTPLNAMVMPPVTREAGKKYPVVTYVYGGPTGQIVYDGWARMYPFLVWLTQNGYGVFMVDNRGAGGRDRKFSRAIHHRFGDVEVVDVFAGVATLKAQQPWVDGDRIGIFGWSYGGYLAARAVLDDQTPFASAVAVAPVTDWKLYDTHYTERYLGMPKASDAYAKSSLVTRAGLLKKPLQIMHGMADDNVLFENTLQLVEALQGLSLPFDFMAYPGRAHGLAGRPTQLHVYRTIAGFFGRTLK